MTEHRFTEILNHTRGFGQEGRTGYDEQDTWIEKGQLPAQMKPLETIMFQRSIDVLLNTNNGSIVVDDELISSKSKGVQNKIVSHRKAGKEGPGSENAACSVSSCLFGTSLLTTNLYHSKEGIVSGGWMA
jgi:hypothetical protein